MMGAYYKRLTSPDRATQVEAAVAWSSWEGDTISVRGPEARKRTRYSVAGRELIDTLDAVRRHDFVVRDMPSHSLKDVARYFGMASPDGVYLWTARTGGILVSDEPGRPAGPCA